jgi:DNA-binding CsgD family transcriptional regulator/PAS domain-containing protein
MDQQATFHRIVGQIYEAATDPAAWQPVLAEISTLSNSHCANLAVLRHDELLFSSWHGFPDYPLQFFKEAVAEDQWRRSLLASGRSLTVGVHFGSREITRAELVKTRFYTDYCKPCDVDYSVAACFLSEADHLGILAVYRGQRRGDYGPLEGSLLGSLLPHLARATAFAARLQHAELLRSSGERAWDLMPWGALLLGPEGQVMFANRMAEEILGEAEGLTVRHGRLVAMASADMSRLRELLGCAAQPTDGPRTGGTMPVGRGGGRRPLQLWAMPLPREAVRFPAIEPAATTCVFLIDPDREAAPSADAWRALFGLTDAEARLVAGLSHGERLEDYAKRSGIRLSTARTHLKSVFAKTDTHRQSELIRLLNSMPQPRQD